MFQSTAAASTWAWIFWDGLDRHAGKLETSWDGENEFAVLNTQEWTATCQEEVTLKQEQNNEVKLYHLMVERRNKNQLFCSRCTTDSKLYRLVSMNFEMSGESNMIQ